MDMAVLKLLLVPMLVPVLVLMPVPGACVLCWCHATGEAASAAARATAGSHAGAAAGCPLQRS